MLQLFCTFIDILKKTNRMFSQNNLLLPYNKHPRNEREVEEQE